MALRQIAELDRAVTNGRRRPAAQLIQQGAVGGRPGGRETVEHLDGVGGRCRRRRRHRSGGRDRRRRRGSLLAAMRGARFDAAFGRGGRGADTSIPVCERAGQDGRALGTGRRHQQRRAPISAAGSCASEAKSPYEPQLDAAAKIASSAARRAGGVASLRAASACNPPQARATRSGGTSQSSRAVGVAPSRSAPSAAAAATARAGSDAHSRSAIVPTSKIPPRASGAAVSAASATRASAPAIACASRAGPIRSPRRPSALRSPRLRAFTSSANAGTSLPVRSLAWRDRARAACGSTSRRGTTTKRTNARGRNTHIRVITPLAQTSPFPAGRSSPRAMTAIS